MVIGPEHAGHAISWRFTGGVHNRLPVQQLRNVWICWGVLTNEQDPVTVVGSHYLALPPVRDPDSLEAKVSRMLKDNGDQGDVHV